MITFNNIVERFKVFAENHFFIETFSFGSPDDVDLTKFTSFPLMHLVYTGATYDPGTKTYNLEVYILDVPADKAKKVDRQKEVVSDAEQCAEDIIADIKNGGNIFLFAQDYEVLNATTTPLEEETKNVLSGVLLDLSVSIPYEWDACNAPIDGVEPGGTEVTYARRGVLRMLTVDGTTDVTSVRTINVTNGTLTDDGDGVVTLDTGGSGAESLDDLSDVNIVAPIQTGQTLVYDRDASPRGFYNLLNSLENLSDTNITSTPSANAFLRYVNGAWEAVPVSIPSPPPSTTDGLTEGTTNLYFTEQRVSENSDVSTNTAKVGITSQQASDITANNAKTGITPTQAGEITANTAKVGVIAGGTSGQALVKASGTDYDLEWADAASGVQYHDRFATDAETFRSGATDTVELYYTAKADGDGLAESASSDTPTAGKVINRKIYYSEAAFADPDTGTWVEFTPAPADDASFATVKAALLEYLKARTGGTVPISLKQTWEEATAAPTFTGLLNESYGSGAAAAYSVRRLNGNYTGAAIEVERTSDGTYQDIGFDANGDLDESALTTFCTGTTCKVSKWYDQSQTGGTGSGLDAEQADDTKQPTIYTGGAIVKDNGRPALNFDNDGFSAITGSKSEILFHTSSQGIIFNVGNLDANNASLQVIAETNGTSSVKKGFTFGVDDRSSQGSNDYGYYQVSAGGGGGDIVSDSQGATFVGSQYLMAVHYDRASGIFQYKNGSLLDSVTATKSYGTGDATNDLAIGNIAGNYAFSLSGKMQEMILYNADDTNRADIEENVGDYYTQNTPLLDTYTGAAAAYSLRKLRTAYTGDAIRVRRSSDNAETDIGFNVFGELDTVSLAAHCGSNDGFVKTWYDQASTNDATQTTTADQPKIYDGTTGVVTENGKPAIDFDGSNDHLDTADFTPLTQANFITLTHKGDVDGGTAWIFSTSTSNTNRNFFLQDGRYYAGSFVSSESVGTSQVNISIVVDGANTEIFKNGSSVGTGDAGTNGIQKVRLFANRDGNVSLSALFQEFIIWNEDDTNRTGIESNINTFYSIY